MVEGNNVDQSNNKNHCTWLEDAGKRRARILRLVLGRAEKAEEEETLEHISKCRHCQTTERQIREMVLDVLAPNLPPLPSREEVLEYNTIPLRTQVIPRKTGLGAAIHNIRFTTATSAVSAGIVVIGALIVIFLLTSYFTLQIARAQAMESFMELVTESFTDLPKFKNSLTIRVRLRTIDKLDSSYRGEIKVGSEKVLMELNQFHESLPGLYEGADHIVLKIINSRKEDVNLGSLRLIILQRIYGSDFPLDADPNNISNIKLLYNGEERFLCVYLVNPHDGISVVNAFSIDGESPEIRWSNHYKIGSTIEKLCEEEMTEKALGQIIVRDFDGDLYEEICIHERPKKEYEEKYACGAIIYLSSEDGVVRNYYLANGPVKIVKVFPPDITQPATDLFFSTLNYNLPRPEGMLPAITLSRVLVSGFLNTKGTNEPIVEPRWSTDQKRLEVIAERYKEYNRYLSERNDYEPKEQDMKKIERYMELSRDRSIRQLYADYPIEKEGGGYVWHVVLPPLDPRWEIHNIFGEVAVRVLPLEWINKILIDKSEDVYMVIVQTFARRSGINFETGTPTLLNSSAFNIYFSPHEEMMKDHLGPFLVQAY